MPDDEGWVEDGGRPAFKVSLGEWTRIRPFLHVGGHSPLYASFRIGGLENPFTRVNLYPTYLRDFGASVGFFAAAGRYEGFAVGLTLTPMPLALGFVRDGQDYQPEL